MRNVLTRTAPRLGMAAVGTATDPQIVHVSLMDTYVPSIPDIKPDDVKLRFPYQQLNKM